MSNPEKLPEMSKNARESVNGLEWNDYYANIQKAINCKKKKKNVWLNF